MAGNKSMSAARSAKNDEFYTRLEDIEREMAHYREHFRDKVVFLNCDDPEESNFWRYFELNFDFLGLRKLISTHYDAEKPTYKLEIIRDEDRNGDGKIDGRDLVKTPLEGNGDFRSPESIALLEESDIVVTNPPFSLFREYVTQLMEFEKDFIILGNMNAITYKETWGFIQSGRVWLGVTRTGTGQMWFRITDDAPEKSGQKTENGIRYQTVGNSAWFTTLDHKRRHEEIVLFREYDPAAYPTYDNYDAIEVSKVADIPVDYYGDMGVPITFLGKHNPDQFEIVGYSGPLAGNMRELFQGFTGTASGAFYIPDGAKGHRRLYDRIVIRRNLAQKETTP